MTPNNKISFISSDDRKYNISRVLSLIKSDIVSSLQNSKNVVIKVSCIISDNQMASTHADALAALLEFISPYCNNQVVLAEGSYRGNTLDSFKNYGYFKTQDAYDLAIVDLNNDDFIELPNLDSDNNLTRFKLARTIAEADYVISICPPRVDNTTIFAGATKNIFEGSCPKPSHSIASKMVQSLQKRAQIDAFSDIAYSSNEFTRLYKTLPKILSILDGYATLQGESSFTEGELASTHWAIASTNSVLSDFLACQLLNLDVDKIGYLKSLVDFDIYNQIVLGDNWKNHISKIKYPKIFN